MHRGEFQPGRLTICKNDCQSQVLREEREKIYRKYELKGTKIWGHFDREKADTLSGLDVLAMRYL